MYYLVNFSTAAAYILYIQHATSDRSQVGPDFRIYVAQHREIA